MSTDHDTTSGHDTSIRWDEFRRLWDRAGAEAASPGRGRTDMIAGALWVSALFLVFVTWNGAAGKTSIGEQIPYLLSGGLATLLLSVAGSVVFLVGVASTSARSLPVESDGEVDR